MKVSNALLSTSAIVTLFVGSVELMHDGKSDAHLPTTAPLTEYSSATSAMDAIYIFANNCMFDAHYAAPANTKVLKNDGVTLSRRI